MYARAMCAAYLILRYEALLESFFFYVLLNRNRIRDKLSVDGDSIMWRYY